MITLSKELETAMFGDAAILRYLDMAREHFERGEKDALFEVLCLCARFQAVIPEWAADALLDAQQHLGSGVAKDFNEVFGQEGASQSVRKRNARLKRITKDVLGELQKTRLDGASLAPDDLFDRVCESFSQRGVRISRRDVEAIYRESGQFVKTLPRKRDPMQNFGFMHAEVPQPRRTGRSILRDDEK